MSDTATVSWDYVRKCEDIRAEVEHLRDQVRFRTERHDALADENARLRRIAQAACDETFEKQARINEAAVLLDAMAEHWEQEARWSGHESDIKRHKHHAADCRAMAEKLRGKE